MKPLSPEWHEARKGLLTASDFAAACGLNPYCSRQELFERKVNGTKIEDNPSMEWGRLHEKDAISAYEAITGDLVEDSCLVVSDGFVLPYGFGCTPDGFVGYFGILEAKCPSSMEVYKDIPIYYLPQVVGQIELSGVSWCDFIVWTPTNVAIWRMNGSRLAWEWMYPRLMEMKKCIDEKVKPKRFKNGEKPDPAEFRKLCDYKRVY